MRPRLRAGPSQGLAPVAAALAMRHAAMALAFAALALAGCEKTSTERVLVPTPDCPGYSLYSVWPPLTANHYYGAFALGDDDVYAVGDFGGIARYDGSAWVRSDAGTGGAIRDIWMNGPTEGFAVGDEGVLRCDGGEWRPAFDAGNVSYACVWGSGMNDVWCAPATGDFLSRWDGSRWIDVGLPSVNEFFDMWGSSSNDIFAVARSAVSGYAKVWRYDGSTWADVTPLGITIGAFYSVWGSSANDVYVVGDATTIRRWNGSTWGYVNTTGLLVNQPLLAIRGRGPSDIYVAVSNYVFRYDGSAWNDTDILELRSAAGLHDLAIGPARLVAAGENGFIASYDGAVWRAENGGPIRDLFDVWTGGPNEAFAVGEAGVILQYDGETVVDASVPGIHQPLRGISGDRYALYAVGGGGTVLRHNGVEWIDCGAEDATGRAELNDVWAYGSTAFAVGDDGDIFRITGVIADAMESGTTEDLLAVWGASTTDVYAVGTGGVVLHFDGAVWAPMDPAGIADDYRSVSGSSPNDVYALGRRGFLIHYDGSSWSRVPCPAVSETSVLAAIGSNDLFLASGSTLFRHDGSTWYALPGLSSASLLGVAGSAPSNVFAAGTGSTILRYGE